MKKRVEVEILPGKKGEKFLKIQLTDSIRRLLAPKSKKVAKKK